QLLGGGDVEVEEPRERSVDGVHLDEVDRIAEPGEVLNIPLGEWKGGRGGEPAPVRPVKIHEWGEGLVFDRNHAPYFLTARAFVQDRKSTRLNSSHVSISYAVFCLEK